MALHVCFLFSTPNTCRACLILLDMKDKRTSKEAQENVSSLVLFSLFTCFTCKYPPQHPVRRCPRLSLVPFGDNRRRMPQLQIIRKQLVS
jgi:hypothetical protein